MTTGRRCPDCDVAMEEGFVPDATYGSYQQTHWHAGPPRKATFFGLPQGTRVSQTRMRPLTAHLCPECGLVRTYADPAPRAP